MAWLWYDSNDTRWICSKSNDENFTKRRKENVYPRNAKWTFNFVQQEKIFYVLGVNQSSFKNRQFLFYHNALIV